MRIVTSLLLLFAVGQFAYGEDACFALYKLSNYDRAVEPGLTVPAEEGLPAHCVVRGVVNRAIRFELRLPFEKWNRRFLMIGTGGQSGYIAPTTSHLHQGFAIASTDTGHVGGTDGSYAAQPEAALDYAFRAVHLVAMSAKELTETFYARDIAHSYYTGCSNGGRQGMIEATRFPEDFDGIVAGAPAFQIMREFMLWAATMSRAQKNGPLGEEEFKLLARATAQACDAIDGITDGVIDDPRKCTKSRFDPASLRCDASQQQTNCLNDAQLETVQLHYRGVVDPSGDLLSPGVMPGAEDAGDWAFWLLPNAKAPTTGELLAKSANQTTVNLLKYWVYADEKYDPATFDPLRDRADLERASNVVDVNTADLSAFKAQGGKILMYQGWNDYPLRPQRAIDYLSDIETATGGVRETRDFVRLFMVPGMLHCTGGPGAHQVEYLEPLVKWVEEGKAPDSLIGNRPDGAFTRRHCAYPETARYRGANPNAASSFVCAAP